MLDFDAIRTHCLSQIAAVEEFPFGPETRVFKVMGKMFVLMPVGGNEMWINVKCDPVLAVAIRETYSAVKPGYHMNKKHWNTITIDGSIPDDEVRDMIDHSYDLVVQGLTCRQREELSRWGQG